MIHNSAFSDVLGDVPGPLGATFEWWKQRVHSEDRERASAAFAKALSEEAMDVSCEYRIRRRNGAWISVDDRACIVRDDHNPHATGCPADRSHAAISRDRLRALR